VPRAFNAGFTLYIINSAFAKRSAPVKAGVSERCDLTVVIKESNLPAAEKNNFV
jgi:hypothetical protein